MKLKLNDDGYAFVKDGQPIFVHDDSSEVPFNALEAVKQIGALKKENGDKRIENKTLKEQITGFDGIDIEKAKEALETVKNLGEKKLIDAGKVDEVKASYVAQMKAMEKDGKLKDEAFKVKENEYQNVVTGLESELDTVVLRQSFSASKVMEKLNESITPGIAFDVFGKNFKREKGDNGKSHLVGYLNGQKIVSKQKIGDDADFDEALGVIIDGYPMKDRILKGSGGGSGGSGNGGDGGSGGKVSDVMGMPLEEYERLKKEGKIELPKPT